MSSMRGKDTLHSNGGCPRLDAVHTAAYRMDTVSILNSNVWGRFRDVLAGKVRFLQVHNSASLVAK
jgi:predicted secreted protein